MTHYLKTTFMRWCVCAFLAGTITAGTYHLTARAAEKNDLSPTTLQELAAARSATAKYHDVQQAIADGYVSIDLYLSGEGFHYVNFSYIDGTFDPARPQVLLYVPVPGEDRLQLVGLEYLVPLNLSVGPLEGFTGDSDVWREDSEGFGFWETNAWVWMHNPEGIFAHDNPLIP